MIWAGLSEVPHPWLLAGLVLGWWLLLGVLLEWGSR
jgi:hypothetical protein